MSKEQKLKVMIKSDGTPEGTSLVVNGADVTKQFVVRSINFTAWASVPSSSCDYCPQDVYLSWSVEEKDDQGVVKTTYYRLSPGKTLLKGLGKGIGDSMDVQFDNDADVKTFKVTGDIKKLEDAIKIEEQTKPEDTKEK